MARFQAIADHDVKATSRLRQRARWLKAYLAIAFMAVAFSRTAAAAAMSPIAAKAEVDAILTKTYPHLEALYQDLHSHPELAFQESRTAARLAMELRALGFTVTEGVGGDGIVAIYHNGPGPVVMVRTEMDALPIEEKTGLAYASQVQSQLVERPGVTLMSGGGRVLNHQAGPQVKTFVSHVCGHDSHMAWWVGTAQALVALKSQWSGTLMFVGQPAEEVLSGAKAMTADGLFTRFPKPAIAFAAHVSPLPAGTVVLKEGAVLAAADNLAITFVGRGGHGASPSDTIDPIVIGAHFVSDVQTVISREKDATLPGVVTIGSFQAGVVGNAIPDRANLKLTIRATTPDVRARLLAGVLRTAKAAADMANAPTPEISELSGTGPVVNDDQLAAKVAATMTSALGDRFTVVPAGAPAGMASEDFSAFADAGVASVYFQVGGTTAEMLADYKAKGEPVPVNHSPAYHPAAEPAIKAGVEVLSLAVMTVLQPRVP